MTPILRHHSITDGRCHWCKRPIFARGTPEAIANPQSVSTKDHVYPQLWGAETQRQANIVKSCLLCNQVKGSHPHEAFEYFLRQHGGTSLFNPREFNKFIFGLALAGFHAAMREACAARLPVCQAVAVAPPRKRDARGRYLPQHPDAAAA